MDLNLNDKVALVTGGSHGLGRAVCLALAAEGAKVAVHYYRNADKGVDLVGEAEAVVKEITETCGTEAFAVGGDVAVEADIPDMFRRTIERFGRLDVLVNNVGYWPTDLVKEMSLDSWDYTVRVNLTAVFLTCQEMVRHLTESGRGGRIVNISSQAAFHGATSGHAHYAAAKGGVHQLTISLAREVAANDIAVNAVAPGLMYTEMTQAPLADEERKKRYLSRIPLGRIAEPEEIAKIVTFMASDGASYMTGATVNASGGMVMR